MGLTNCSDCGKLCLESPTKLCNDCYAKEEEFEHAIGEYLRDHGKATVEQIHRATGVKERIIMRMLKSGRLFSAGMVGYPCEMCGKPIYEGRLCNSCNGGFMKQVKENSASVESRERTEPQRGGMRMYTKDK